MSPAAIAVTESATAGVGAVLTRAAKVTVSTESPAALSAVALAAAVIFSRTEFAVPETAR